MSWNSHAPQRPPNPPPPAAPPEPRLPEVGEDLPALPQLGEARLPEVPGGDRHVRAGRHVPVRRDPAVVLAGGAGAVGVVREERRAGIELPEDPAEVGGALGPDEEAAGPARRHAPGVLGALEDVHLVATPSACGPRAVAPPSG